MPATELDERAVTRRLERKLRADCVYLGATPAQVARLGLDRLLVVRHQLTRELMAAPSP